MLALYRSGRQADALDASTRRGEGLAWTEVGGSSPVAPVFNRACKSALLLSDRATKHELGQQRDRTVYFAAWHEKPANPTIVARFFKDSSTDDLRSVPGPELARVREEPLAALRALLA
jgi:hypothetical protein